MQQTLAKRLLTSTASAALVAMLASGGSAQSPQAPTVAAGSIAVTRQGQTTVVTQGTDKGIIDWRSFSIGPQEAVRFDQPGRSSVTLNRVTGTEQSRIDGNLSATGQVWLANPNGVMIGPGGQVNVGGLLATTGRIDAQEFLRSGKALIDQIPKDATILNAGSITTGAGGYAALAASAVENKGVIQARTGAVAMGSGKAMTLDFAGDKLITFQVTQPLDQKPAGAEALVTNSGEIVAPGGSVLLSARAAKGVIDNVINLKGKVIANSIRVDGGAVILGDGGATQVSGALDVSDAAGVGGKVEITAPEVIVAPSAVINASGATGGGSVKVKAAVVDVKPAAQISARAMDSGNGGRVSLRADKTLNVAAPIDVRGGANAGDGGSIEAASGGVTLLTGKLIADAPSGKGGSVAVAGGMTIQLAGGQISAIGLSGGGTVAVGAYLSDLGYVVTAPQLLDIVAGAIDASAGAPTQIARILPDGSLVNAPLPGSRGGVVNLAADRIALGAAAAVNASGDQGGVITARVKDSYISSLGARLQANAVAGDGGAIAISGPQGVDGRSAAQIVSGGAVSADSQQGKGGAVAIAGGSVTVEREAKVSAKGGARGGRIDVAAVEIIDAGALDASGGEGGAVTAAGRAVFQSGAVVADGFSGRGGSATIVATENYQATQAALLQANGATDGGAARILGTADGTAGGPASARAFTSGTMLAQGGSGRGGAVDVLGRDILLVAATADASGGSGGGAVRIGGDWQGSGAVSHARSVISTQSTILNASALRAGDGGKVVVWSDETTRFTSRITAKGAGGGAGGKAEVSSKGVLTYGGSVEAASLLLDPKNIIIDVAGDPVGQTGVVLTDPGLGGGAYGTEVKVLPNGNIVVTSPSDSTGGVSNRGAAYLFSGVTGGLLSALSGSSVGDSVSSGGVTVLPVNGNYVVSSPSWNAGTGAVTWRSATGSGASSVSIANSLIGSTPGDTLGYGGGGVIALTNGNYVVSSPYWTNGAATNAGAVTWGDGNSGVSGTVSIANSLIGVTAGDQLGNNHVYALTNGNYVVASTLWSDGPTQNVGAVTRGDGASGTSGTISAANSLIGSTAYDYVGGGGVTALANGNFVVASPAWNNGGTVVSAGAVTWGNGATGATVGPVSALNSLVGSNASDQVGSYGVIELSNSNYVVNSANWNSGSGAVTWGNGVTGGYIGGYGAVSSSNSLIGSLTSDRVGLAGGSAAVTALTNGNYVVTSSDWTNGGAYQAGAVTLGNGASGTAGVVSTGNSLVGSVAGDRIGFGGGNVAALSNGNYVVSSPYWSNGTATNVGAVTWVNGTTGLVASVSASNSLVGSVSGDSVGNSHVFALKGNGNYVVASSLWNSGAGAVTWLNGAAATNGTISAANSITGSSPSDYVGVGGVLALPNGNYVAQSPNWSNGTAANAGAATWGNGTTGLVGVVTAANSLVGSSTGDQVGTFVIPLASGAYVVGSPNWSNGTASSAGAVTWGNGATGVAGPVSVTNSLVGSTTNDKVGLFIAELGNNKYVVNSASWTNGTAANVGAITLLDGASAFAGAVSGSNSFIGASGGDQIAFVGAPSDASFVVARTVNGQLRTTIGGGAGLNFVDNANADVTLAASSLVSTLAAGTAVTLQANNDITVNTPINVTGVTGGALTMQAGRSIILNAGITTANGDLTLIANERAANGVVDAHRDSGAAVISAALGANIDTGTGNLLLRLNDGAGLSYSTDGAITLRGVTAKTVTIEHFGASFSGVALNGPVTAAGAVQISVATGDIAINDTVTLTGGSASFLAAAGRDILIPNAVANAKIITGGGGISLISDSDEIGGGAIVIGASASLVSNGGDILLSGGTDPFIGRAMGRPTLPTGVEIAGSLDAGAGTITIRGGGASAGATQALGVNLTGALTTTSGAILIDGIGGTSAVNLNAGVWLGGPITTQTGAIDVVGSGGTGANSDGVVLAGTISSTGSSGAGLVRLHGIGNGGNTSAGIQDAAVANAILSSGADIQLSGTTTGASTAVSYGVNFDDGMTSIMSSGGGNISISGSVGASAPTAKVGLNIIGTTSITATGSGAINLDGTAGGSGGSTTGIYLGPATISATSGSVSIHGKSLNTTTGIGNRGVDIATGAVISGIGGAVSIVGEGGAGLGGNEGVVISGGAIAETTGAGSILVVGAATANAGSDGVIVSGGGILRATGSGGLTVNGTRSINSNARNIQIDGVGTVLSTNTGNLTIDDLTPSNATGAANYGVAILAGAKLATADGTITVVGRAGNGGTSDNIGVYLDATGTIAATGAGSIILNGSGGVGTGTGNTGVTTADTALIQTNTGAVSITGNGGGGSSLIFGAQLGGTITTASGAISFTGTGGTSTGSDNGGVVLDTGSLIQSTGPGGAGAITITGFGGDSTGVNNHGVALFHTGHQIQSNAANVTLTGTAGPNGTGSGIDFLNADLSITSVSGAITLDGSGRSGAGVRVAGGTNSISTTSGGVTLRGNTTGPLGLVIDRPVNAGSGQLTLEADSFSLTGVAKSITGTGPLTIRPGSVATTIGVGAGAAGALQVDAAAMASIDTTFSSLTVGRPDGTGNIEVGAVSRAGSLTVLSGSGNADVTISGTVNLSGATSNFTAIAGRHVSVAGTGAVATAGGAITLNSDADAVGGGAIQLAAGASLTSNGGDITLGGGANPLTGYAMGVGANVEGIKSAGALIDSGAGTISMRGMGSQTLDASPYKMGVFINGGTLLSAGGIVIDGVGGNSTASESHGVGIGGAKLSAGGSAPISITGQRGGDRDAYNISIGSFSTIETTGGNLTIAGTSTTGGGTPTALGNVGVGFGDALLTSTAGSIQIDGAGGSPGSGNDGIRTSIASPLVMNAVGIFLRGSAGAGGVGLAVDGMTASAVGGVVMLQADTLSSSGTSISTSGGHVSIQPLNLNTSIGVGAGVGTLQVSNSLLASISGRTIIGRVGGTGAIDASSVVSPNDLMLVSTSASASISGVTITGAGNGLNVASSSVALAGTIATAGTQTYGGPVTLNSATALSSGNGSVSFASSVDGANSLTVSAGSGILTFGGPVGGAAALTDLTSLGSGQVAIAGGLVKTSGSQSYAGGVLLASHAVLSTANNDVIFAAAVDAVLPGAFSLTTTLGTGVASFAAGAGAGTPLASLTVGKAVIAGDVKTVGPQNYGDIAIQSASTFSTVNSAIVFSGALDGPGALTLATGIGAITQPTVVGALIPLASFTQNGTPFATSSSTAPTTPSTASTASTPSTPTATTVATSVTTATSASVATVASIPSVATNFSSPSVVVVAPIVAPIVIPPPSVEPTPQTQLDVVLLQIIGPSGGGSSTIISQILQPPVNFGPGSSASNAQFTTSALSDGLGSTPSSGPGDASDDPNAPRPTAPGARSRPSANGGEAAGGNPTSGPPGSGPVSASRAAAIVSATPAGALIPPTPSLLSNTGAPLASTRTVRVDPIDAGGNGGQTVTPIAPSSGSAGVTLIPGLVRTGGPGRSTPQSEPPLAQQPSNMNEERLIP